MTLQQIKVMLLAVKQGVLNFFGTHLCKANGVQEDLTGRRWHFSDKQYCGGNPNTDGSVTCLADRRLNLLN